MPGLVALLALKRYVPVIIGILAAALVVYGKGRSDCAAKHSRQAVKDAAQWAEIVRASDAAAYARGRSAAESEARNQEKVDAIGTTADKEPGAGDVCLSGDVVERLRELL